MRIKRSSAEALRFAQACGHIAWKLNRELTIRGTQLTAESVALVASGQNLCASHPALSAIEQELRKAGIEIA
jgi:hypothetical protein